MSLKDLFRSWCMAMAGMACAGLLIAAIAPTEPVQRLPIMLPAESARVEWIAPPRQWSGGGYWYRFGPVKGGQAGVMPLHTDVEFHNHPEWEH